MFGIAVGWLDSLWVGFISCGEDVVMPKGCPEEFSRGPHGGLNGRTPYEKLLAVTKT